MILKPLIEGSGKETFADAALVSIGKVDSIRDGAGDWFGGLDGAGLGRTSRHGIEYASWMLSDT